MTKSKVVICPYCGDTQPSGDRCRSCGGLFEPLSRQATHNAMGPWFLRDPGRPFQPGASYETLARMVERGIITKYTIVRGPTTKQYWTVARHTPGVAHLLGYCHQCDASVNPRDLGCPTCGAPFGAYLDRNHLGLPEIKALPWESGGAVDDSTQTVFGSLLDPDPLRPQAPGLSSFGTDEELVAAEPGFDADWNHGLRRTVTVAMGTAAGVAPRTTTATLSGHARHPPSTAVQDTHTSFTEAHLRSLQRRLSAQQRTMQWLLVLLGLIAVLAVGAAFSWFGLFDSPPVAPTPPEGSVGLSNDGVSPGDAKADDVESADGTPLEPTGTTGAPEAPPSPPLAGEEAVAELAQFQAEFDRAVTLAKSSADVDAPIDERIATLRNAIASLRTLLSTPVDRRPVGVDVDSEIQRWERELRRLEVEREFPD